MASLLCGVPSSHTRSLQACRYQKTNRSHLQKGYRLTSRPPRCSNQSEESAPSPVEQEAPTTCPTCGVSLDEAPGGCDKLGRVVGGVGAIAGFDWWPIKAYRPCPALEAAGVPYTRKGQLTNEVLFGKAKKEKL